MRGFRLRAFTLIELLIVVAIIAILAAIAVPNFLEAQVRAKTARVKSDMRTLAMAIESYNVDNNRPPTGWLEGVIAGKFIDQDEHKKDVYNLLTTPISYITAIPSDPFAVGKDGKAPPQGTSFVYECYLAPSWAFGALTSKGFRWGMRTVGPAGVIPYKGTNTQDYQWSDGLMASGSVDYFFDPTNGTTSMGWIERTNKGFYPAGGS